MIVVWDFIFLNVNDNFIKKGIFGLLLVESVWIVFVEMIVSWFVYLCK